MVYSYYPTRVSFLFTKVSDLYPAANQLLGMELNLKVDVDTIL